LLAVVGAGRARKGGGARGKKKEREQPNVDVSTMSLKGIIKLAYDHERTRLEQERQQRAVRGMLLPKMLLTAMHPWHWAAMFGDEEGGMRVSCHAMGATWAFLPFLFILRSTLQES
jgi:hypothetical protein